MLLGKALEVPEGSEFQNPEASSRAAEHNTSLEDCLLLHSASKQQAQREQDARTAARALFSALGHANQPFGAKGDHEMRIDEQAQSMRSSHMYRSDYRIVELVKRSFPPVTGATSADMARERQRERRKERRREGDADALVEGDPLSGMLDFPVTISRAPGMELLNRDGRQHRKVLSVSPWCIALTSESRPLSYRSLSPIL
jgi:hypothetical protein